MLKFLVFAALVASAYSASVRIVNGTDAEEGEFPFAVVLKRNNRITCGATILNENFILTAAHCVCDDTKPQDADIFSIQFGFTTYNDELINVRQVANITCNTFNSQILIFDSAILELESPISGNATWEPVTLPREFNTTGNTSGVIIGWGRLTDGGVLPRTLQKLNVDIYDNAQCGVNFDIEHHICFGAPSGGACNGDSGTALLVNDVQVGIASFITDDCGISNPETPNVYSRVTTYLDWIQGIAGNVTIVESP